MLVVHIPFVILDVHARGSHQKLQDFLRRAAKQVLDVSLHSNPMKPLKHQNCVVEFPHLLKHCSMLCLATLNSLNEISQSHDARLGSNSNA
jgi:hypothetical protein